MIQTHASKKVWIAGIIIVCLFLIAGLIRILISPDEKPVKPAVITESALRADLAAKKDRLVFFYDPECKYCRIAKPVVIRAAKKEHSALKIYILKDRDHDSAYAKYGIKLTPTLVHFKNGKEVYRLVGSKSEREFRAFFQASK